MSQARNARHLPAIFLGPNASSQTVALEMLRVPTMRVEVPGGDALE